MATSNSLNGRVSRLEYLVPEVACRSCAARPAFNLTSNADPCPVCGVTPRPFTIDIDRASGSDDDAAA